MEGAIIYAHFKSFQKNQPDLVIIKTPINLVVKDV